MNILFWLFRKNGELSFTTTIRLLTIDVHEEHFEILL